MEPVNLQKSYAKLNESMSKHFDERGVKRNFTVPYINQPMADHVSAVGAAAKQSGGLGRNLVTTFHHSDGKGYGHPEGATIGHPADSLRTTIIPKHDEHAKEVIDAAQKHLNNIKSLLGDDDPTVKTAQGQLNLVKKTDGAGMTLLDFGTFMIQIMLAPNQAVARAHDQTKPGGMHPRPRPPVQGAPAPQQAQDESQTSGGVEPQGPIATPPASAPASAAPAPEAPAAGQGQ